MNILKLIGKIIGALIVSITITWLLAIGGIVAMSSNLIYSILFVILTIMLIIYCIKRVSLMPIWEKKLWEIIKVVLLIACTYILVDIASLYLVIPIM